MYIFRAKTMELVWITTDHIIVIARKVGRDTIVKSVNFFFWIKENFNPIWIKNNNCTLTTILFSFSVDREECDLFPCLNNGTCINTLGSYVCNCSKGWQNKDCKEGQNKNHNIIISCKHTIHSLKINLFFSLLLHIHVNLCELWFLNLDKFQLLDVTCWYQSNVKLQNKNNKTFHFFMFISCVINHNYWLIL